MPWLDDPAALAYDCSALRPKTTAAQLWQRTCHHALSRHQPRQPARRLSWREPMAAAPSAMRLVSAIQNRTVWILGDSHALDLWCALTCLALRASSSSHLQHGPKQLWLVTRVPRSSEATNGLSTPEAMHEARWRIPTCAYAKGGKCGVGTHCGTLGRASCTVGCGLSLLPPPNASDPSVVLYSPCPAYLGSPLMRTVVDALGVRAHADLDAFRALPHPPLQALCEKIATNCSGSGFALSHAVERYIQVANAAVQALRRLHEGSAGRSIGVLVQAPTTHFPEVVGTLDGWTAARLDSVGSYERLVASALHWFHRRLQGGNRSASALASALSIASARPTSFRGELSGLEPSLVLGLSWWEEERARAVEGRAVEGGGRWGEERAVEGRAVEGGGRWAEEGPDSCATGAAKPPTVALDGHAASPQGSGTQSAGAPMRRLSAAVCELLQALEETPGGAAGVLRTMRATRCRRPAGAGHTASDAGAAHEARAGWLRAEGDWRHRVELEAARAAGVPLLDVWGARRQRWDLHPAIQGGANASVAKLSNRFDCAHSSLAPGAFDAEVTQLQLLLGRAQ